MAVQFNPFTGNLDIVGAGASATPGGSDTQVQFNNAGAFGGSADLTWDDTGKVLGVGGDVDLDDGGTYTTTLQTITATANRTISFPDATGTVGLVAGSSGQLIYNNAGANAGTPTLTYDGSILTSTGRFINSYNATASSPAKAFTGTWFTGGTATTTKPQVLIEPTGTTSTAWSTSGTGLGVNAASGFAGNLLDLQVNASRVLSVDATGRVSFPLGTAALPSLYPGTDTNTGTWSPAADTLAWSTGGSERLRITSTGLVGIGASSPAALLHTSASSSADTSVIFQNPSTSDTATSTIYLSGGSIPTTRGAYISNGIQTPGSTNRYLAFAVNNTGQTLAEVMRLTSTGLGVATTSPTVALDVNSTTIRVRTARTPASATATGAAGEICWDDNYVYVCTATNTWKRSALSTW